MQKTVFIAIGANLGNRTETIGKALRILREFAAGDSFRVSSLYETVSVGASGPDYLNAVCSFETSLSSGEIHRILVCIEQEAGRVRTVPNAPRTLDLDLLFCGSEIISTADLSVPHPRLESRAFVLVPLAEIAPDWVHPVSKRTAVQALQALDAGELNGVRKYDRDPFCGTVSSRA